MRARRDSCCFERDQKKYQARAAGTAAGVKIKKEEEFFSAVCTSHQALRVCKRKTLKNSGGL